MVQFVVRVCSYKIRAMFGPCDPYYIWQDALPTKVLHVKFGRPYVKFKSFFTYASFSQTPWNGLCFVGYDHKYYPDWWTHTNTPELTEHARFKIQSHWNTFTCIKYKTDFKISTLLTFYVKNVSVISAGRYSNDVFNE